MEDVYEDREQRVERIELARLLYANAAANVNTAHTILLPGSVSACVIAELCGYSLAFLHRNECNPPIRVKLLHPVPNATACIITCTGRVMVLIDTVGKFERLD